MHKKIECENGWIVFIVRGSDVHEVHSTGEVHNSRDDRAFGSDLLRILSRDAMRNQLHSQQPGRSGVRWPEEE